LSHRVQWATALRNERAPYTDEMKERSFDVNRLDVEAFAKHGATLRGQWSLATMDRLIDCCHADWTEAPRAPVVWRVQGELRKTRAAEPQIWLRLDVATRLALVCQRCLAPVDAALHIEKALRFVRGEDAAAELDADSDDDVLDSSRNLDLRSLIEDELLLALPLVPRHDECPPAYREPVPSESQADDKPNPFSVLAALKRRPSSAQ
jgi:uncharacterized protein